MKKLWHLLRALLVKARIVDSPCRVERAYHEDRPAVEAAKSMIAERLKPRERLPAK